MNGPKITIKAETIKLRSIWGFILNQRCSYFTKSDPSLTIPPPVAVTLVASTTLAATRVAKTKNLNILKIKLNVNLTLKKRKKFKFQKVSSSTDLTDVVKNSYFIGTSVCQLKKKQK